MHLILASSSPYRQQLLKKLGLNFNCESPHIDETRHHHESAEQLVARLAVSKARAIAKHHSQALIIGSDQVAEQGQDIIGKPGNHAQATRQLQAASGQQLTFVTGLCLYNSATDRQQLIVDHYKVNFLTLTPSQIEAYLRAEQPYHCAGSFKSEGLGITLFSSLEGKDPNSLIGLPLIELTRMLRAEGIEPLEAGS
ncbi:MAG: Maf family nucleotide pyrophosphatase [Cellvibrionaceae bacterium]|nr:Maf family nucleotide pyrophosphatase [Cellvibrionaceae bacterium]